MVTPINLNKARKARAKAAKAAQSQQNRVKFGRNKTEKQKEALRSDKAKTTLSGHKLDKEDPRS